jgi:large subunit ribosomal protein L5
MTIKERYAKEIVPKLMKELELSNVNAVPAPTKVILSVGISPSKHKDGKLLETAEDVLKRVSGQKSVQTKARVSISNFKTRKGQVIGLMVTLRGKRMWDFIEKLVAVTFPRIRDFRGVPRRIIDGTGSLSYGFAEHLAFPEIRSDEIERVHGLQMTISTSAHTAKEGTALFEALGFPFQN